ncbi:MAG: hypothetical protein ABIP19_13820 [Dermatophilaceae bacterium]
MPEYDIPPPITGGTLGLDGRSFVRLKLADRTLNLVPQAWAPDGARIAFEGWDDSDPARTGIYTARYPDGGDLLRVTNRPGAVHDVPLDYSPDGHRLVFYRSVGVDPDPHVGGSLWTVAVDGSGARRISGSARPADWARWSKDGTRILFATERTAPAGALWTVSPEGTNLNLLFQGTATRFPIQPTWSPDASKILFGLDPTNDQFAHPANSLDTINADGTGLQVVDASPNFKSTPEWIP